MFIWLCMLVYVVINKKYQQVNNIILKVIHIENTHTITNTIKTIKYVLGKRKLRQRGCSVAV